MYNTYLPSKIQFHHPKDITFVEQGFEAVPPQNSFEISSSFCHFAT